MLCFSNESEADMASKKNSAVVPWTNNWNPKKPTASSLLADDRSIAKAISLLGLAVFWICAFAYVWMRFGYNDIWWKNGVYWFGGASLIIAVFVLWRILPRFSDEPDPPDKLPPLSSLPPAP